MARSDAPKGWWQRNWGWCLGCGCLLPILVIGAILIGGRGLLTNMVMSNEALTSALIRVNDDPRAIELLGSPITTELWREGTEINFSGKRRLRAGFRIFGPEGAARLEVEAHATSGPKSWQFDRLEVIPETGGEPIDLLEKPTDPSPPAGLFRPDEQLLPDFLVGRQIDEVALLADLAVLESWSPEVMILITL